jgi:transposase
MGISATRNGMRIRNDLLAAVESLARARCMGQDPSDTTRPSTGGGGNRLVAGSCRQHVHTGGFWGAKTGPNPTDRRKFGSKHHVITDANGIPLATTLTGANAHDSTQLMPLVNAIPPVQGKRGRPRRRPKRVQGDRAYDSQPHRKRLRRLGIVPVLAKRNTEHGSGLGVFRWVVERTNSWLHQFRRLRVRFERRDDIHEAFLTLGCILICFRFL